MATTQNQGPMEKERGQTDFNLLVKQRLSDSPPWASVAAIYLTANGTPRR